MLVDCPNCTRSYQVSADDVGERGRVVICPRCDARWFLRREDVAGGLPLDIGAAGERPVHGLDEAPASLLPSHLRRVAPFVYAGLFAAMAATSVVAREPVVRAAPRMAALYALAGLPVNVRGLEIVGVAPTRSASSDVSVSGDIRNVASRRVGLPRVSFEVRDTAGAVLLSWSETPPVQTLGAGRKLHFTSMPHRLPADSRTVLVRFEPDSGA